MTESEPASGALTGHLASPGDPLGALPRFARYFEVVTADTPELIEDAYRLRYEVYCLERGFENRDEHPDHLERDEFDSRARHSLLIHRSTGQAVGTVRLVVPEPTALETSFAIQRVTNHPLLQDTRAFPVATMAEISRFSLSKTFRRRAGDTHYGPNATQPESDASDQRSTPPMRLGLMQGIVSMSAELGLTHWCAVMEPTLLRILSASEIHFTAIGPMVDYHGRRQPCFGSIRTILEHLYKARPDVWAITTKGGETWDLLCKKWLTAA